MIVACLQYKSLQNEKDTLKKIIPLIEESKEKKVDLVTLQNVQLF